MELLITTWSLVAVAAMINYIVWRWPPTVAWLRYAIVGAAGSGIGLLLLMILIAITQVEAALWGLVIALLVALAIGGALRLYVIGWRPTLPRLSIPLRMAWPQARYKRQFASRTTRWTVEDIEP
jgi:hypothetical protein